MVVYIFKLIGGCCNRNTTPDKMSHETVVGGKHSVSGDAG